MFAIPSGVHHFPLLHFPNWLDNCIIIVMVIAAPNWIIHLIISMKEMRT